MTPLLAAQLGLTLFVFVALLHSAAAMVWVERKVAALLQQRFGPTLVGPSGLLQPFADVIKLMFKEELRPAAADKILSKIECGEGEMRDLDLLSSISGNIAGTTLCAFGDAAVTPVVTTLKHFRAEYEVHVREGRCPLGATWRGRVRHAQAGAH